MQYIHVRNLEKYQDGYKDRRHYWAKIYVDMIQGNAESEMLNEIDFARLVKFIVLESCTQKMTIISEPYLVRKGFDFALRNLQSTLKELSHFIEIVNVTESNGTVTESLPRKEEKRIEKKKEDRRFQRPNLEDLKNAFKEKGFSTLEAEKFLNYYESVGWVVGGSRKPMKNWRGAVATWCGKLRDSGVRPKVPQVREEKPKEPEVYLSDQEREKLIKTALPTYGARK